METVSSLSVILMAVSAAVGFFLPVVLLIVLRKKRKIRIVPALIGAAAFVVSALILEAMAHQFLFGITGFLNFLKSNPFVYALYGGLMAGLFEESGRFAAFKLMRNKYNTSNDAVSYGIGHGGIESILLLGFAMVSNIILAAMINSGSLNNISSILPAGQKEATLAAIKALTAVPAGDFLIGGVERLGAITFHIGTSILVYLAASRRAVFWFYPLAVLLHTVLNIPAGLYQAGAWKDLWVLEMVAIVFAALVLYFALKMLKATDERLQTSQE